MNVELEQSPTFRFRAILPALIAIVLGSFMAILDSTVVNVALPTLGKVFSTEIDALQWVITGYMLAMAAVVPLSGWLGDRYSARRVYVAALAMFTAGSALCAFAPNVEALVFFRVVQGLGAGVTMPTGMAMIFGMVPSDRRGTAMSIFGIPMLLGPALGPVLSGWLLQYADWRLIFLINVPVGAVAVVVGLRALPRPAKRNAAGPIDAPGVILAPLAFAGLAYGISEVARASSSSPSSVLTVGAGGIAFVLFVWRELTTRDPLLELRVFRSTDFVRGTLVLWTAFAGMAGTMFLVPLFLQQACDYSALETGLYMLPGAISSAVVMQLGGRWFDRVGIKLPVTVGLGLAIAAMWLFSRISPATTGIDLALPMILQGSGMGLLAMPLNAYLLGTAPPELVGRVSSLNSAFQNLIGSLAIAAFATTLHARMADLAPSGPPTGSHAYLAPAFGAVYGLAMASLVVSLLVAVALKRNAVAHVTRPGEVKPVEIESTPLA